MTELNKCEDCGTSLLKEDMEDHMRMCSKSRKRRSSFDNLPKCKYCKITCGGDGEPKKHESTCTKRPKKRKSINPHLRSRIWEIHVGISTRAKCFCCWKNEITPFTGNNVFHAGHIHSHFNGGKESIENLIPICRDCNTNMSSEHWDDYIERHPGLPLRTHGANLPAKVKHASIVIHRLLKWYRGRRENCAIQIQRVIRGYQMRRYLHIHRLIKKARQLNNQYFDIKRKEYATIVIQSLARMYLERKKPDSEWRREWRQRQMSHIEKY